MNILKSLIFIIGLISLTALSTNAYFNDEIGLTNNRISTGVWSDENIVINEVYYNVAPGYGEDADSPQSGEWIELYNAGDNSVNLKDWTITDNDNTKKINAASHILLPGHFALISKDHSIWSLYWKIPQSVEIIELGQTIGNGLENNGDHLILKDNDGKIIDELSYGNDTSILSPSIPLVAVGHAIERNPAGFDTNSASDFVDRTLPTPGN